MILDPSLDGTLRWYSPGSSSCGRPAPSLHCGVALADMHVVEILPDGSEEHLTQCMELDAAAQEVAKAPEVPPPAPKPQPLVKLLQLIGRRVYLEGM